MELPRWLPRWLPPLPSPRARRIVATGSVVAVILAVAALLIYSSLQLARFARVEARRTTFIYAAGQALSAGVNVDRIGLATTLKRLNYQESRTSPAEPGFYRRAGSSWEIHLRATDATGGRAQKVRLALAGSRIDRVTADGRPIDEVALEPEVLAGAVDQPGEAHRPVRLVEVPAHLTDAVLAIEDHRFFEHGGVDLFSLPRALWRNLQAGRVSQGASTITQQLVKLRLLSAERTVGRKLAEAWLATLVEWRYSKHEILSAYLNEVYLGQRGGIAIRGVGTGARAYFGKEVHQLSLAESATLAGMLRAPNTYSPAAHPTRARERRDVVLDRMRQLGKLDDATHRKARQEPVRTVALALGGAQLAPYFVDQVREELEARFGALPSGSRDWRIFTSLDPALQRFAEAAVARGLDRLETARPALKRRESGRLQAVLVALDPTTGEIRALVGGRDYQASQFNRAALAHRQPGSAFKPIVFLAALRMRGERPVLTAASRVDDAPITMTVGGRPWSPRNYDDHYEGAVSVRRALELSLNGATVRIAQAVGLDAVVETARGLGVRSPLQKVPALALGAFEVTPLELARAYAPLANGGTRPTPPHAIHAVDDGTRVLVPEDDEEPAQVISPAESYLMTSLLQGVILSGTGASAAGLRERAPVAGKTGTTNEARDAWFVGYTPRLVVLVWVGFDETDAHGMSGAQAALPIWTDFMSQTVDAYPQGAFAVPEGVVQVDIDAGNGKKAGRYCPVVAREVFLAGSEPELCEEHRNAIDEVARWWQRVWDLRPWR